VSPLQRGKGGLAGDCGWIGGGKGGKIQGKSDIKISYGKGKLTDKRETAQKRGKVRGGGLDQKAKGGVRKVRLAAGGRGTPCKKRKLGKGRKCDSGDCSKRGANALNGKKHDAGRKRWSKEWKKNV